jgi:fructokinase
LNDHEGKLPAFSVEVKDTTGAGDGFVAGFIHQLCRQGLYKSFETPESVRDVVRYASAVGALTTLKPGAIAAQPTAAEVEAFLQEKG